MTASIDINSAMLRMQNGFGNKTFESISSAAKSNRTHEQLEQAAKDFEAVFMTQFLEIINSTVERSEEFSGGRGEETFRSMLNQEIAKSISSSPHTSIGLAKQVYEQMKHRV